MAKRKKRFLLITWEKIVNKVIEGELLVVFRSKFLI